MNRRGEAITIAVVTVASICMLVGLLFRPIVDKVLPIFGNNQKIVTVTKSTPILLKQADGKEYWVQKTESSISNAPVPMTLMQRIMMLPTILIILIIVGCIFPPIGAILMWLYVRLKGGFKQLVIGVEEAKAKLPIDAITTLETSLSKKMDTSIKAVVKKIKVKL